MDIEDKKDTEMENNKVKFSLNFSFGDEWNQEDLYKGMESYYEYAKAFMKKNDCVIEININLDAYK